MERITISGKTYVLPDCCSFGDYGGAGSVGLANIRAILELARDTKWSGAVWNGWSQDVHRAQDSESRAYESDETTELRKLISDGKAPLVLHVTYDYSGEAVYMLETWSETKATLVALESYPALDDEASSEIEMEWENEAWANWLRSDLERAAWPDEVPDAVDDMSDADKFTLYRDAMEACNEYPEAELNGVYVRVERIAETYRKLVEVKL